MNTMFLDTSFFMNYDYNILCNFCYFGKVSENESSGTYIITQNIM